MKRNYYDAETAYELWKEVWGKEELPTFGANEGLLAFGASARNVLGIDVEGHLDFIINPDTLDLLIKLVSNLPIPPGGVNIHLEWNCIIFAWFPQSRYAPIESELLKNTEIFLDYVHRIPFCEMDFDPLWNYHARTFECEIPIMKAPMLDDIVFSKENFSTDVINYTCSSSYPEGNGGLVDHLNGVRLTGKDLYDFLK